MGSMLSIEAQTLPQRPDGSRSGTNAQLVQAGGNDERRQV